LITKQNVDQVTELWGAGVGSKAILDLAFSPDSSLLAIASEESSVSVFRTSDGERVFALEGHAGRVYSVAFSPDGSLLASGGVDRNIILWRVSDGQQVAMLQAHDSFVKALAFSPDGSLLASGGEDRDVILWQLSDNSVLYRFDDPILSISHVAFSPDGRYVISAGGEVNAYMWEVETGDLNLKFTGLSAVHRIAFSPDGATLVGGAWTFRTSYLPDGSPVTSGPLVRLIFWDALSGEKIGTSSEVTIALDIAYFPDGVMLVTGSADDYVLNFWNPDDGVLLYKLTGPAYRSWAVDVSPNGAYIASGGEGGELILWGLP
jgi:WD40 repeat protein